MFRIAKKLWVGDDWDPAVAEDATLVGKGTCPTAVAAFHYTHCLEAPGVIVTVPFRLVGTIMTPKMPGKKELDTSGIRTCAHPRVQISCLLPNYFKLVMVS